MTKPRRAIRMNVTVILSNVSTLFVVISVCCCEGGPISPSPLPSDYLNRHELSEGYAPQREHNGLQVDSKNSRLTGQVDEPTGLPTTSTRSTTLPKVSSSSSADFTSKSSAQIMISSYSTSFPVYMARCRATCLEQYQVGNTGQDATVSGTGEYSDTKINEMHLSPILRLRRSTSNYVQSCNQSSDCVMCWKSCKLIQTQEFSVLLTGHKFTTTTSRTKSLLEKSISQKYGKTGTPKPSKSKHQSILPCSVNKHCMAGCQVACSFYSRLLLEISRDAFSPASKVAPAMNPSSGGVHITGGKFKWPRSQMSPASPVVYVVIQEYPDRKWRQIAQTTETEISIPQELSITEQQQLCTVLVVGPSGLEAILSYHKTQSVPVEATSESSEKVGKVEASFYVTESPAVVEEDTTLSPSSIPLELHLVSLSHQRSLVIAEVNWEESESETKVEYLVTWELTRGGLKGHLVTDSNSVTLSLWPDTSYEIQVELFQVNIDTDGDVATLLPPTAVRTSVPLIVNTSTASLPFDHPSALLIASDADEFPPREDYNPIEFQHGRFIYRMLSVGIVSLVCSLILLTLIAFTWSKFKLCECKRCSGNSLCCWTGKNEGLLNEEEPVSSSVEEKSAPSISVISQTVSSPLTHLSSGRYSSYSESYSSVFADRDEPNDTQECCDLGKY